MNDLERCLTLFDGFPSFSGFVPKGFLVDFLGCLTDARFRAMWGVDPDEVGGTETVASLPEPSWGELFFEPVDWFEAAREAQGSYTMVTLGACYGAQAVGAYQALQRLNPMPCRLVAVEPEPTNFAWLKKHFRDNGIDTQQHWLINCAVSDTNKPVLFPIGAPGTGVNNCVATNEMQSRRIYAEQLRADPKLTDLVTSLIVDGNTGIEISPIAGAAFRTHIEFVSAVTLADVLAPLDSVDLLESDIQQSEILVFPPAMDVIKAKVKRLHIGTHGGEAHARLLKELSEYGLEIVFNYEPNTQHKTAWGSFDINDGIITARNPSLLAKRAGRKKSVGSLCGADAIEALSMPAAPEPTLAQTPVVINDHHEILPLTGESKRPTNHLSAYKVAGLFQLGRAAIEQNHSIQQLVKQGGLDLPGYRALPDMPPLCFFHIPKTAGGAVTTWLHSMFPADETAPYTTDFEFAHLRLDPQKYRLYSGHILGRFFRYMPRKTQLVTIVRDPVARAVSEYFWIRDHLPIARKQHAERWAIDPNYRSQPNYMIEAGEFFQAADALAAFSTDTPAMRSFFRDPLLSQLARVRGEDVTTRQLDAGSPVLRKLQNRQWARAVKLLKAFSVVGDYSDLEGTLLLIAAMRGWPAPPPLPRVHDLGAPTRQVASESAVRERFRAMSPYDVRLHELACARARNVRADLEALCGRATADAVDRFHAQKYFADAPRVLAFDIEADAPRNGSGWDFPQRDGDAVGKAYRRMPRGRPLSTLALLDAGIDEYRFFCRVIHSVPGSAFESLRVTVNGTPLERVQTKWWPWDSGRALVLEWRLPRETVAKLNGRVEFVMSADLTTEDSELRLGRMGCVPAELDSTRRSVAES
jgi:FkbM family methyltransferase